MFFFSCFHNYVYYVGGYTLHVSGYSAGTAGDSLSYHDLQKFSTKDNDNDPDFVNCANLFSGAWWYKTCYYSNLNGKYSDKSGRGIRWYHFRNTILVLLLYHLLK